MNTTIHKQMVSAASALLVLAIGNGAWAFPSRGGSCTDCHSDPGGSLTASPNLLEIAAGDSGLLTFTITSLGGSSESAISVQGLENPELDASIAPGGDNWTYRTNSTYGSSYVSDAITSTGMYTLNLAIGDLATPGSYPIVVMLAGDGGTGMAYDPGFTLQVTMAGLTGDYNRNGGVDAADYVLWRKTLGQTGAGLAADGNGNDEIDAGDYALWRANFGQAVGSVLSVNPHAAVPEPTTAVILLWGIIAILVTRSAAEP